MKLHRAMTLFLLILAAPGIVRAEDSQIVSIQNNMAQLQEMIRSLQTSMTDLKMTVQSQNEVIRQQAIQIEALQSMGTQVRAGDSMPLPVSKQAGKFTPDISVTGTTQVKLTENKADEEGNNSIALKELELNFSQAVDPFSRLDAILSFNDALEDQNVEIEEAYYTRWGLPLGFTAQLGKFRSNIGKQNLLHGHQLETADYALVIRDFFGEEGLASSGLRLQNSIPNPWNLPLEITGEVLRGNNGTSFSGVSRRPIFNTHLKTFFETSENSNLEIGWTTLFGDENPPLTIVNEDDGSISTETRPEGSSRYGVKVFGADATWKWFLPEGKAVKWQSEIYSQSRTNLVHINENPWGFYSLVDYRFSPRFSAGLRFDYLNPLDVTGSNGTIGVSPYLIFWQSEFADLKLQYSHTSPQGNVKADNAVYISVDFMIGDHKHSIR